MSDETTELKAGETETLTGEGTVTTSGNIQSTITEPVVPVDAPVDAVQTDASTVVEGRPAVTTTNVEPVVVDSSSSPMFMYNGHEVKKRFGLFDADGAEECELSDGSTAFVPKSIFGE